MSNNQYTAVSAALAPYRHEKRLFLTLAILSGLFWTIATPSTLGIVWFYMLLIYLFSLIGHSMLITHLQGNAVRIDEKQFPELHARLVACSQKVGMEQLPETYLLSGNGVLNAFATRFLRRYYVVLLSDVVDALDDNPEAINFYIGHELGHIARKHVVRHWLVAPAMLLPLVGTAYRRAQEYTCDQAGLACCADLKSASHALAVLAAGSQRWKQMNTQAFIEQMADSKGFWMSLNELTSEYPWLCKRMARIHAPELEAPRRHPLAWFIAAFLPNFGPGGLLISIMIPMLVASILISIGLGSYHENKIKQTYPAAFSYAQTVANAVQTHYDETEEVITDLATLGVTATAPETVKETTIDPDSANVTLEMTNGKFIYMTAEDANTEDDAFSFAWTCSTTIAEVPEGVSCESLAAEPEANDLLNILNK
jgi:Zn-dependent protease with chaperone function/Tfp pilus assembly protein PilE